VRRLAPLLVLVLLAGCGSEDAAPSSPSFLPGGVEAFEARIDEARGKPVVVNKWASWCGPCRLEFPFFRRQAEKRKGEVLFIGVNSNDNRDSAEQFLKEQPVPFKHFEDPKLEIAAAFKAVQAFPATAFYDSRGELAFVHQGPYTTEKQLAEAIDRYAR
jgi:cytochrome c biogenesis protein CcmG/thiol:disulfide interchange protein DsbE